MNVKRTTFVLLLLSVALFAKAQDYSSLNYLTQYNAFFVADFTSASVDTQGRMAIGSNCNITSYGVATDLPVDCSDAVLIVGVNLNYNAGTANGLIVYGNTANLQSVSDTCGAQQNYPINFGAAAENLRTTSQQIGQSAVNGQTSLQFSSLVISGTNVENYVVVDSSTLSAVTSISINIPADSWIFITVTGSTVNFSNLDITLSPSTNISYVLWNFAATSLTMTGISVKGSILAPNAAIDFTNGNIDGSLCGNSFNGNGELHNYPYVPPGCVCPVCPPAIIFPNYSLFVEKDINLNNTDDQGAMAAGGDVTINNYSIGTMLSSANGGQLTLAVAGNLAFTNGSIDNGDAKIGGSATLLNVGVPNGSVYPYTDPDIDFASEFQYLADTANQLSTLSSNGQTSFQNGDLTLTGTDQTLNVFSVSSSDLSATTAWTISAPSGSHVIVNIPGSQNSLVGMQTTLVGVSNTTIILNFYESTSLVISQTSVQGTVLAPLAVINFTNGNIDGSMFCVSVFGTGETHLALPVPITINYFKKHHHVEEIK